MAGTGIKWVQGLLVLAINAEFSQLRSSNLEYTSIPAATVWQIR